MPDSSATYTLRPLPYGYADLEPVIDEATMRLHHDKHHQAYVDATNAALAKWPQWQGRDIDDLLAHLAELPAEIRNTVRNQGGGLANHDLFWEILSPKGGGKPTGDLADRLKQDFGSLDSFKKRFVEAGVKQFGSGWVFLSADPRQDYKLEIVPTSNQDSVVSHGRVAVFACDVWEHAYYLKYNNRRVDWLNAWWDVVNWDAAARRLTRHAEPVAQHA